MTPWNGKPTRLLFKGLGLGYNLIMKIDVNHIAKLAGLKLTPAEVKKFESQLGKVLDYIGQLSKVSTEKVEPTGQVTGLENVKREDKTGPSLSQEEVLANTKQKQNGMFKIPAIFD